MKFPTENTRAHPKIIVQNLGVYNRVYRGKPQLKILAPRGRGLQQNFRRSGRTPRIGSRMSGPLLWTSISSTTCSFSSYWRPWIVRRPLKKQLQHLTFLITGLFFQIRQHFASLNSWVFDFCLAELLLWKVDKCWPKLIQLWQTTEKFRQKSTNRSIYLATASISAMLLFVTRFWCRHFLWFGWACSFFLLIGYPVHSRNSNFSLSF